MLTVATDRLHVTATFNTTPPYLDKMVAEQIKKPADISRERFRLSWLKKV
jgi:hypothetical protein